MPGWASSRFIRLLPEIASCITTLREALSAAQSSSTRRASASWSTSITFGGILSVMRRSPCSGDRIAGYHVNDFGSFLRVMCCSGRGMMGDGVIESFCAIRTAVEKAGYRGPIEVEIFNEGVVGSASR